MLHTPGSPALSYHRITERAEGCIVLQFVTEVIIELERRS